VIGQVLVVMAKLLILTHRAIRVQVFHQMKLSRSQSSVGWRVARRKKSHGGILSVQELIDLDQRVKEYRIWLPLKSRMEISATGIALQLPEV
jgi:hypothetical protein